MRIIMPVSTMNEIVQSLKRVTDIMSEISAASEVQRGGIEQVNQAILRMDDATQQNAVLVEEAAATTVSLKEQKKLLSKALSVFKFAQSAIQSGARKTGDKSAVRVYSGSGPKPVAATTIKSARKLTSKVL